MITIKTLTLKDKDQFEEVFSKTIQEDILKNQEIILPLTKPIKKDCLTEL